MGSQSVAAAAGCAAQGHADSMSGVSTPAHRPPNSASHPPHTPPAHTPSAHTPSAHTKPAPASATQASAAQAHPAQAPAAQASAGQASPAQARRVLLVTNDFPPTIGGIQSYLADFLSLLDPESVVVYVSTQDAAAARAFDAQAAYRVERYPGKVMLPTPRVRRDVQRLIREHNIDVVWFGAAAPLAVLGGAARAAGARRIVASTHGHEVGWSMLPGARQVLGLIGARSDVLTYISDYTLGRLRRAFGGHPQWQRMPSGVDAEYFRPASPEKRAQTRAMIQSEFDVPEDAQVVVCCSRLVARKGQDKLILGWPTIAAAHPNAHLVLVGEGSFRRRLEKLRASLDGQVAARIHFTGRVPRDRMRDLVAAADVCAIPCRTRGGGLDVEGLGIVFLEAQACAVPVIAGDSGGAPETVSPDAGIVVPGHDGNAIAQAVVLLLDLPAEERAAMGQAGRAHVQQNWSWELQRRRLHAALGMTEAASD